MSKSSKRYWRSPGQLKNSPEYRKQLLKEYSTEKSADPNRFSRRSFLTIMGASMALAGLAGCRRPVEKIVPYVKQPEEVIPGIPMYFASTMIMGTAAFGIIVESHEGRPTKIEGNPSHPSSSGATNIFMQAAMLNLYDPDRSNKILFEGKEKKLNEFLDFWQKQYAKYKEVKGEGLAVLSESFSSPSMARLKREFEKNFPKARWVAWEPVGNEESLRAIRSLTGQKLRPLFHYDKADVIVSIDSDLLHSEEESISAAQGFSKKRELSSPHDAMNRLYVIESGFSITGAMADHRLRLRSGDIGQFVLALAKELNLRGFKLDRLATRANVGFNKKWLAAICDDLAENAGQSVIVAGRNQPQWVQEAVLIINESLGNTGNTIAFIDDNNAVNSSLSGFRDLMNDIELGKIETLIIAGGNPVYNAPVDYELNKLLHKITNTIRLGDYVDETSLMCGWHLPRAHFLESWNDARSSDGTLSVVQPLIAPLFNGLGDLEFLALIVRGKQDSGHEIVRETFAGMIKGDFERGWRKLLHDGVYENTVTETITPVFNTSRMLDPELALGASVMSDKLEVVFRPSHLFDGRFANNGWLQELPDPITKLVWDNAAVINDVTAKKYNLANGDVIKLRVGGKELRLPVWIIPGWADYSIGLSLGYGRKRVGRIADNIGFNTYRLRSSGALYTAGDVSLIKTSEKYEMSNTQDHNRMEGRPIFREATFDEYKANPKFAAEMVEHPPLKSIFPDYDYSQGYQWGMVIDLNACIGCGVCTIACQSENNIPIVGKEQVGNGREMHWMRHDRYFTGDEDNPGMVIMPVACQHCENAPCEQVCPVAATTHDKEGLNVMTYNRCIGTRYCSNNCPYKVRKFNFFNYTKDLPEVAKMSQNPDVTVRSRGVMEKCTFCLQRIVRVKRTAKKAGRLVLDGEWKTACQQACPTNAIKFGNIVDTKSEVAGLKKLDRNYELLAELNVRPRNSYLAKIRNPNKILIKNRTVNKKH